MLAEKNDDPPNLIVRSEGDMHFNGMCVACLRKQQCELVPDETTDAKREAFHAEVDETIFS